MLILDTTLKKLEVVLDASPSTQLPWTASFVDITTTAFTPASSNGVTNSTTAVTMVAAPAASTQRQVKFLSIFNVASSAVVVTVQLNDSSTLRTIVKVTLQSGDNLTYVDGIGFRIVDSSGLFKSSGGGDTLAIHKNVAAEISSITEKTVPVDADLIIIEDSAASNVKKKVQIGNLPPTLPAWLDIVRDSVTGDQTGIETDVDILMDTSRGNDIAYNTTTGVVTLKANRTYRLWATFGFFSIDSGDTVAIQWVKASDNLPLVPAHETRIRSMSSSSNGNSADTIEVIFNPTVDTDVKLRCTEYTASTDTCSMYWERSNATVIELR